MSAAPTRISAKISSWPLGRLIRAVERLGLFAGRSIEIDGWNLDRFPPEGGLDRQIQFFRALFESAPLSFYLLDLRANIIDGSTIAAQSLGYGREELIGMNLLKSGILPSSQIPRMLSFMAKNILGQPGGPAEFLLVRKDGSRTRVEASTWPARFQKRKVILGIARYPERPAGRAGGGSNPQVKMDRQGRGPKAAPPHPGDSHQHETEAQKNLVEETQDLLRRQRALLRLSIDLSLLLSEHEVCQRLAEGLYQILSFDFVAVFLMDEATGEQVLQAIAGWTGLPLGYRLSLGKGTSDLALGEGELHYTPDVTQEPCYIPGLQAGSEAGIALRAGEEVIGALIVQDERINAFSDGDLQFLTEAANQASIALERARQHQALKKKTTELSTLFEASRAISSTLDLEEVLRTIAEQLVKAVDADVCSISRWDRETDSLLTWIEHRSRQLPGAGKPEARLSLAEYPSVKEVLETRQPLAWHLDDRSTRLGERVQWGEREPKRLLKLPLLIGDKAHGLVEIDDWKHERPFTANEIRLCQTLIEQAAIAIENARLHAETQQRLQEQIALRKAIAMISSSLDLETVLSLIAEQMARATNAAMALIYGYEPKSQRAHLIAEHLGSFPCGEPPAFSGEETLLERDRRFWQTMKSGNYLILQREEAQFSDGGPAHFPPEGINSILYIPLWIKGKLIGVAALWECRPPGDLSRDEIMLCRYIAQQAAIALENARLHAETEERLREQIALRQASAALSSSLDLKTVLSRIAEQMGKAIDVSSAYICSYDPESMESITMGEYLSRRSKCRGRASDLGTVYRESDMDFRDRMLSGQPMAVHVDDPHISDKDREHMMRHGGKSILYIPLMMKDRLLGFTELWESGSRKEFSLEEIRLCQGIAQHAAIALENARLYDQAQTEIAERKIVEARLAHDALHDGLTGLANRALFMDRLRQSMGRSRRRGNAFALLFLDLDEFKGVNDHLGHLAGDQLLIAVAKRLQTCLREVDTIARLGGDEFVILLEDIQNVDDVSATAQRIHRRLKRGFRLGRHTIYLNASIGIALGDDRYKSPEELLRNADLAMYHAKGNANSGFAIYDMKKHPRAIKALPVEEALQRAIERQEFSFDYQPIISLRTMKIVGAEALLRWHHPDRGVIRPGKFIPLAEETGLIIPLGEWALGEACRQMGEWRHRIPGGAPFSLRVNLSADQLKHPDFIDHFQRILEDTAIDASDLVFEIAERAVQDDRKTAARIFRTLQGYGAKVHLDSFGAGISSLAGFNGFAFDGLKIARFLLKEAMQNRDSVEVLRAIIALGRNLNMEVIAKGVETKQELGFLIRHGCTQGQGNLFSRPVSAPSLASLISTDYASLRPGEEQWISSFPFPV